MKKSSVIVIILAIVFAGYVVVSPFLSEPIKVVSSSLERGESGNVYIKGIILNKVSTRVDADVEVTFLDREHHPLDTAHLSLRDVPGESERAFKTEIKNLPAAESYVIKVSSGFHNPYGN